MSREQMSRPSSSVPHQCFWVGGSMRFGNSICAGSYGASKGAKSAQKTNTMTNATPMAASGLRRARCGSEMEAADICFKSF